jgi:hypothetical protein
LGKRKRVNCFGVDDHFCAPSKFQIFKKKDQSRDILISQDYREGSRTGKKVET